MVVIKVNKIVSFVLVFISFSGISQITSGKILFERKTNLIKKFSDENTRKWLGNRKVKIDVFELYFNDTISVFKPKESDLVEEMEWTTSKNTVYQNLRSNQRLSVLEMWGDELYIKDSLRIREWKITNSKRKIAGYECRRAIWQKDDTTRIHAWFSDEILPPLGPETFNGLPGLILGLATEDGGIVYFAKSVIIEEVDVEEQIPKIPKKKKLFTETEMRKKLEERLGNEKKWKTFIEELFTW